MHRRCLGAITAALVVAVAGCGDDDAQGERPTLTVFAASSMREALEACAPGLSYANVRTSFGGSDQLAAQIRQGVQADVFVAANTELTTELTKEEKLDPPVAFASNVVAIGVPLGSKIDDISDLADDGVSVAIGSKDVPVGSYTRTMLDRLPADERRAILANVKTEEPDAKGVIGKLTQGAVDAGLVYTSDLTATKGRLGTIDIDKDLQPEAAYGAGVVTGTPQQEAAERFVDGLVDGPCHDALRARGFGPPPSG